MKLRVLGNAGAELPNFRPTALLIDDAVLLDAGTIGAVLNPDEQFLLKAILISHAHHDHILGVPALAENLAIKNTKNSLALVSTKKILSSVRRHVFNNVIWPDFTKIPLASPVLRYIEITPKKTMELYGYSIEAVPVDHTVPSVGYILRKDGRALLYTGDTGPTKRIWGKAKNITSLIIEVSFPNRMEQIALQTGHLTPFLMKKELEKMKKIPPAIFVTHFKPQFYEEIKAEVAGLNLENVALLEEGKIYNL
jgi:ribonuclease BN (tRNA processing enzyme)